MQNNERWASALATLGRRAAAEKSLGDDDRATRDRRTCLPRLLIIAPDEVDDPREDAARRIVQRLAAALRAERARGRAGHWTYDLNRHIALSRAYIAERRRLVQLTGVQSVER